MKVSDYIGSFDAIIEESKKILKYEDIESYLKYAYDIKDDDGIDLYGKPVRDYDNVAVYYLSLFDRLEENRYPTENFKKVVSLCESAPGVQRCQVIFVGPNSLVPWHKDGMHLTDEERENGKECNVIIPVFVPDGGIEEYGIQIEETQFAMDKPFVFENKFAHYAWNKSDKWWVMLICYTHKDSFKL
jgi:hypothetical protein